MFELKNLPPGVVHPAELDPPTQEGAEVAADADDYFAAGEREFGRTLECLQERSREQDLLTDDDTSSIKNLNSIQGKSVSNRGGGAFY